MIRIKRAATEKGVTGGLGSKPALEKEKEEEEIFVVPLYICRHDCNSFYTPSFRLMIPPRSGLRSYSGTVRTS